MPYQDWAIIQHPRRPQLLMLPSEAGWQLPLAEHTERHFWQSVAPVNQAFSQLLQAELTALRCVWVGDTASLYLMECHSPGWQPPSGARWVGQAELSSLRIALPEQRAPLTRWFEQVSTATVPANRPPWYQPGWFARASGWVYSQLDRLGTPATAPIEQLRSWERSAILRARTASGLVYFKAVPAMFAHELALAQKLAALHPGRCAPLLACDQGERWMLMPEAGSQTLDAVPDLARWQAALRDFAQLQIDLAGSVGDLVALGCPLRPLDQLAGQIDGLLADTEALTPPEAALSAAELAALRGRAGELKAMCADLARAPIPPTLEHGDFWAGQVLLQGATNRFIDWSDSSIAHPFFSMNFFVDTAEAEQFLPGIADLRLRLRDAYLEPWAPYAAHETLVAAFELAEPLSALHNAVTYHQWILPNMEAKWEMQNMIPFYLRKLL